MKAALDILGWIAGAAMTVGACVFTNRMLETFMGVWDGTICPECLRPAFRGDHKRCKPPGGREW